MATLATVGVVRRAREGERQGKDRTSAATEVLYEQLPEPIDLDLDLNRQ